MVGERNRRARKGLGTYSTFGDHSKLPTYFKITYLYHKAHHYSELSSPCGSVLEHRRNFLLA